MSEISPTQFASMHAEIRDRLAHIEEIVLSHANDVLDDYFSGVDLEMQSEVQWLRGLIARWPQQSGT